MGFLASLLGLNPGKMIEGVATAIDKFVETPEERKAAELLLMKMQQNPDQWQAEINKIESGHRSVFVAGWRPFIGWVCGVGLCWSFIGLPLTTTVFTALSLTTTTLPVLQTGPLMTLVMAMLGLGATRTYEKKHNLTK